MSDLIPPPFPTTELYRPIEVFVVHPPRPRTWLHILLFVLTIFTTLVVGARMQFNFLNNQPNFTAGNEFLPFFPVEWALAHPARLMLGIPFSATLLLILFAHEMGHYLYCRYYRVHATLPFFIPAPTLIGTVGAVIRIRSPIRSRAALFDIGIAGPIAGFMVALATLFAALLLSRPQGTPAIPPDLVLGFPLIFRVAHRLLAILAPNSAAALPLNGILFHPMAVAAWVGMFATALNLLPSGQLDGGHIVYALWPRAHRWISWMTVLFLIYLGWHYAGWRVWAALITAMNILSWRQRQAPDFPAIRGGRKWLAALALLMLILTFAPVPFHGPDIGWR
jgi:membrane-associated protease RseP (regulator of RpoE activity)